MPVPYKVEEVQFIREDIGIDHFTLPVDALKADGFNVRVFTEDNGDGDKRSRFEDGNPSLNEFLLKEDLLDVLDDDRRETIVVDIQVGKGKTTAFYDLIEHLYKDESNVMLVLSPFKKLVEKDYQALSIEKGLDAFSYLSFKKMTSLATEDLILDALEKRVHVLSINCLLRNPGEDVFEQAVEKNSYLDRLLRKCQEDGRSVHLFFDEIHESIHNFRASFLPYLMKWEPVVKRCFVSTATYTVASYPVIKYIACLTDNNIVYLFYPRKKWNSDKLSKIHLHIVDDEYSGKNLAPLIHLKDLLERNQDKQINILAATKSIVEGLQAKTIRNNQPNPLYEVIKALGFNEVTGGGTRQEKKFDPNGNNIGTVFKTGVSIENPNSLFIIILPTVTDIFSERGIFSDGLPSMIQAMARLRKGGDIHIFMHKPKYLIEPNYVVDQNGVVHSDYWAFEIFTSLKNRLLQNGEPHPMLSTMVPWKYKNQFDALKLLIAEYKNEVEKVKAQVALLNVRQQQQAVNLGFHYPSFEQFTMDGGGQKLLNKYVFFGGDLSSLMLWACMNGQFVNANLESIHCHSKHTIEVKLQTGSFKETLSGLIPSNVKEKVKGMSLRKAFPVLQNSILKGQVETDEEEEEDIEIPREFNVNGNTLTSAAIKNTPEFIQAILMIYSELQGVILTKDDLKGTYIRDSVKQSMNSVDDNAIVKAYQGLYEVRLKFLTFCKGQIKKTTKGRAVIPMDAYKYMPIDIVEDAQEVMAILSTADAFVRADAISIWQKIVDKEPQSCLKSVFGELKNLFTNISSTRVPIKKVREYLSIEGDLERPLPDEPKLFMF